MSLWMCNKKGYRISPIAFVLLYKAFSYDVIAFEKCFLASFFLPPFSSLEKSLTIGVATKIEEYVPTTTPMIIANANPLMFPPPNMNNIKTTNKVVNDVTIVLLNVLLIARLSTSSVDLLV